MATSNYQPTIADRRRVIREMDNACYRSSLSAGYVDQIAHRCNMGVERTRRCLKSEYAAGNVARRRSWDTPYRYFLTNEGQRYAREMRGQMEGVA